MSAKPDPYRALRNSGGIALQFPSNVEQQHFLRIEGMKRESSRGAKGMADLRGRDFKDSALGRIMLPMPASLSTAYNMQYANEDMGPGGELIATIAAHGVDSIGDAAAAAQTAFKADKNIVSGMGAGALAGITSLGTGIAVGYEATVEDYGTKGVTDAIVGAVALRGPKQLRAGLAAARGVAANPHRVVLFQGVNFREHQFAYRLSPRDKGESDSIRGIINTLRAWMHPNYSTSGGMSTQATTGAASSKRSFLKYPHIFRLSFSAPDYLFEFKPSILKTFAVQYHPQGYAAYISDDTGSVAPAEVEITMSFQEMDMWDRASIEKQADNAAGAAKARGKARTAESLRIENLDE
jgi:hypothetical protein